MFAVSPVPQVGITETAAVAKLGELEIDDMFGTSSEVFSAKKYVVLGVRPETTLFCDVPAIRGVGSADTWVAELNWVSFVIADVEYLRSYDVAVPVLPSSPGDVHVTVIESDVAADRDRDTDDGEVVSGGRAQ
jgi:hypothetical protein